MLLSKLLKDGCTLKLSGSSVEECFRELAQCLKANGLISDVDRAVKALLEREELRTTATGNGVAVPHAVDVVNGGIALALGCHKQGLDMQSPDGEHVHVLFMLLMKPEARSQHLNALARIAKLIKTTDFVERAIAGDSPLDIILTEEEKKLI